MAGRVTLQTIADRMGVSRTTVSNAYNRPDQLTSELREQILAMADELGYHGPDAAARMLRTGRMGTIGLVFTEDLGFVFNDPDTTLFMQGVAESAAESAVGLTMLPVPEHLAVEKTALSRAAVDGYLVFSIADDHPVLDVVLGRGVPVVIVDEPDLGERTSFVGIDDREGARLAASHLVDRGHSRIAILMDRFATPLRSGPVPADRVGQATVRIARERVAGYRDGLAAGDIEVDRIPVWEAGGNDPDRGRLAAGALLEAHPETTGLLCSTDQLAIGATTAAAALGRSVPDDLSVVGFDDVPRAGAWHPPLTTVCQPLTDKGRLAVELLFDQIDSGLTKRVQLPVELVVRRSTGPPSSARVPQA